MVNLQAADNNVRHFCGVSRTNSTDKSASQKLNVYKINCIDVKFDLYR